MTKLPPKFGEIWVTSTRNEVEVCKVRSDGYVEGRFFGSCAPYDERNIYIFSVGDSSKSHEDFNLDYRPLIPQSS